jgi:hypothetical protein
MGDNFKIGMRPGGRNDDHAEMVRDTPCGRAISA